MPQHAEQRNYRSLGTGLPLMVWAWMKVSLIIHQGCHNSFDRDVRCIGVRVLPDTLPGHIIHQVCLGSLRRKQFEACLGVIAAELHGRASDVSHDEEHGNIALPRASGSDKLTKIGHT